MSTPLHEWDDRYKNPADINSEETVEVEVAIVVSRTPVADGDDYWRAVPARHQTPKDLVDAMRDCDDDFEDAHIQKHTIDIPVPVNGGEN